MLYVGISKCNMACDSSSLGSVGQRLGPRKVDLVPTWRERPQKAYNQNARLVPLHPRRCRDRSRIWWDQVPDIFQSQPVCPYLDGQA